MEEKAKVAQKSNYSTLIAVLVVAAYGAVCLLLCYIDNKTGVSFTICPLKNVTGIPCPTCGGTRAVYALLQGHIVEAFYLNPLVIILLLSAMPAFIVYRYLLRGYQARIKKSVILWIILAAAVIVNWIYLIRAGR